MQRSTCIVRAAQDDNASTTGMPTNAGRPMRLRSQSESTNGATDASSPRSVDALAKSTGTTQEMKDASVSRVHNRLRTSVRAVLYSGTTFQTTLIRDISLGGVGLSGAEGLFPGEPVKITLLNGASQSGVVRWWFGGCCGVQFDKPLMSDDPFFMAVERRGGVNRG